MFIVGSSIGWLLNRVKILNNGRIFNKHFITLIMKKNNINPILNLSKNLNNYPNILRILK